MLLWQAMGQAVYECLVCKVRLKKDFNRKGGK